jgi:hypothetical protein
MSQGPKRRWFQFCLETIFLLVAILAGWLAWESKFARDREALIARFSGSGEFKLMALRRDVAYPDWFKQPTIPVWRCWLGDEPINSVVSTDEMTDPADIKTLERFFPKADFVRYDRFLVDGEKPDKKARTRRSMFSLTRSCGG